jgi:DNA helicase MCM8
VACANPQTGHYNRSRTISENIKLSNAILSRFDLVFLLLDEPDLKKDKMLSQHIMNLHSRNRKINFNQLDDKIFGDFSEFSISKDKRS